MKAYNPSRIRLLINSSLIFITLLISVQTVFTQERSVIISKFQSVIKQKKYRYYTPEKAKPLSKKEISFLQKSNNFIKKILRFIGRILYKIFGTSRLPYLIIYFLFCCTLAWLIIWMIRYYFSPPKKIKIKTAGEMYSDYQNLDFQRELNLAKQYIRLQAYQEAINALLTGLWLFYHYKKIIIFNRSITNREYLKLLQGQAESKTVKSIIYTAEKAVYAGEKLNENVCNTILADITNIVAE